MSTPIVFTSALEDTYGDKAYIARVRNVDNNGFQVKIQMGEGHDITEGAMISYFAINEVTGLTNNKFASKTASVVTNDPFTL